MRSILDKAMAALLEGKRELADKLFHDFVLERARQVNESIVETGDANVDAIVGEADTPAAGGVVYFVLDEDNYEVMPVAAEVADLVTTGGESYYGAKWTRTSEQEVVETIKNIVAGTCEDHDCTERTEEVLAHVMAKLKATPVVTAEEVQANPDIWEFSEDGSSILYTQEETKSFLRGEVGESESADGEAFSSLGESTGGDTFAVVADDDHYWVYKLAPGVDLAEAGGNWGGTVHMAADASELESVIFGIFGNMAGEDKVHTRRVQRMMQQVLSASTAMQPLTPEQLVGVEDFNEIPDGLGYEFNKWDLGFNESASLGEGKSYKRDDEEAASKKQKDQERKQAAQQKKKPVSESMKLVKTVGTGSKVAKVYKDSEWDEYQVKFFVDGKHQVDADAHEDELDAAVGTAKHWVSEKVEEGKLEMTQGDDGTLHVTHEPTPAMPVMAPAAAPVAPMGVPEFDADLDNMDLGDEFDEPLPGVEDLSDDEAFESLKESLADELEKIVLSTKDGEFATNGKVKQEPHSPVPNVAAKDRFGKAKAAAVKGTEHNGFDREPAPKTEGSAATRNVHKTADSTLKTTSKEGDSKALLNQIGDDKSAKSPVPAQKK